MRQAVLYARVSSKDQEREGYSIPAQVKLLREYARTHSFEVVREFLDVETAKKTGRKSFTEMVRFFEKHPSCRVVLVEKTDRLYRNFRDYVTLEDLGVEIHLPKEGQILGKDAKSQDKLVHGIHVVIARNYVENLREEVRKGMREKAEHGIYPSRPPLGYRNNKALRTIEVDPERAPIAQRMFELYATGNYSLSTLRTALIAEFGRAFSTFRLWYLEELLKNPFYIRQFKWEGKLYPGTHPPLVSREAFEQVQQVFQGRHRPRKRKYEFAFTGLLRCAYDDCAVTAEMKKNKYTYYRCTGYRGKCENLHGHNWKVVLSVKGGILNEIGLLVDFTDLKTALKKILNELDHTNINEMPYFTAHNPSSEHIAQYIAEKFTEEINSGKLGQIALDSVTVWESATSRCTYIP